MLKNERFRLLFIMVVVLVLTAPFLFSTFKMEDEGKMAICFIIFAVGILVELVLLVILLIKYPPKTVNEHPEEDDIRIYALKNSSYNCQFRKGNYHPLASTGSVLKHKGYSRGLFFSNSRKLVKAILVALSILLLGSYFTLILYFVGNIKKPLIIILVFAVITIMAELLLLMSSRDRRKLDSSVDINFTTPLIDLINEDSELSLMDKRRYNYKIYLELSIGLAKGYFEISSTQIIAFILDEKELRRRDEAKDFHSDLYTECDTQEVLDGIIVMSPKYIKNIGGFDDKKILGAIKDIINEYNNRKPSIFDNFKKEEKKTKKSFDEEDE